MSKEKKVIIMIVEGPSDESAVGFIVKDFFPEAEVRFYVVHGDITAKYTGKQTGIVCKVHECIKEIMRKYRYHKDDIQQVIHLADTDGVFITDEDIVQADCKEVLYYADHIEVPDRTGLIRRNEVKSDSLYKLSTTGKVYGIPYRIYYMSCNLEHVLYGELRDFTNEEKWCFSDRFASKYEGHPEKFVKLVSDVRLAVPGSYKETWNYIEQDHNSLKRHTNFHLMFDC